MVDPAQCLPPVQKSQHHALAKLRGDRRDAHVQVIPSDPQRNTAVLRKAFFSDVEFAHHLDPADKQRRECAFRADYLA